VYLCHERYSAAAFTPRETEDLVGDGCKLVVVGREEGLAVMTGKISLRQEAVMLTV